MTRKQTLESLNAELLKCEDENAAILKDAIAKLELEIATEKQRSDEYVVENAEDFIMTDEEFREECRHWDDYQAEHGPVDPDRRRV